MVVVNQILRAGSNASDLFCQVKHSCRMHIYQDMISAFYSQSCQNTKEKYPLKIHILQSKKKKKGVFGQE